MNSSQFITKQRAKYLWKALRRSDRITGNNYRSLEGQTKDSIDSFWDFEVSQKEA